MANRNVGIRFLIWTYFNLDTTENKEAVIKRCIALALKDAINEGAFNAVAGKGELDKEGASTHLFEKIRIGPADNPFDTWHDAVCGDLLGYYSVGSEKNPPAFSYGNAQKWLNMTIKYLYIYRSLKNFIVGKSCEYTEFCSFYDDCYAPFECDFHIPIDSFILEGIWDDTAPESEWVLCDKLPRSGLGEYNSSKHVPWSNFDKVKYEKVQELIKTKRSKQSPMEWENEKWVGVAKKRKNK